jgi:hypothetical protein
MDDGSTSKDGSCRSVSGVGAVGLVLGQLLQQLALGLALGAMTGLLAGSILTGLEHMSAPNPRFMRALVWSATNARNTGRTYIPVRRVLLVLVALALGNSPCSALNLNSHGCSARVRSISGARTSARVGDPISRSSYAAWRTGTLTWRMRRRSVDRGAGDHDVAGCGRDGRFELVGPHRRHLV